MQTLQVVFEIDTPAHTLAIGKAHPEMMTDCWEWMASARYKTDVDSDDCMALDPTNSAARQMVAALLGEVAALEGASPFVHVGGDEGKHPACTLYRGVRVGSVRVCGGRGLPLFFLRLNVVPTTVAVKFPCWNASATVAKHVAATYGDLSTESFARLQAEWTANVSCAAVAAAGKRPVLWQPTTMGPGDPAWDGALPRDAVYMIWLNAESAKSYATNGSDVVYTTPFYVAGMGGSGWTHVYNAQIMVTCRPHSPARFLPDAPLSPRSLAAYSLGMWITAGRAHPGAASSRPRGRGVHVGRDHGRRQRV